MSLRSNFLEKKSENQNFPQMTRIGLENWHLGSKINVWCKHKFTNVVLSLCWQMSKLTLWNFWSPYFDQHLPMNLNYWISGFRKMFSISRLGHNLEPSILRTNSVFFILFHQILLWSLKLEENPLKKIPNSLLKTLNQCWTILSHLPKQ